MKEKTLKVITGSRVDMAKEFIEIWHQAKKWLIPTKLEEKIYFKNEKTLLLDSIITEIPLLTYTV